MPREGGPEESSDLLSIRSVAENNPESAATYLLDHLPASAIDELARGVFNDGEVSFESIRYVPASEGPHFVEICRAFLFPTNPSFKKEFALNIRKFVNRHV